MKSSLEIAQEAELVPIEMIAESCGLQPDEIEPYGRYKGKVNLSVIDRLADRPDGKLICFDISEEFTSIARRYWQRAGVADRVELRLGPAVQTLRTLPEEPHIDLAFIDADKVSYEAYWAAIVPRMRPGGVIVVDNVLYHGEVLAPRDPDSTAVVAFNTMVLTDPRVETVMIPLADGVTLARRLP